MFDCFWATEWSIAGENGSFFQHAKRGKEIYVV
jgi:hypothetical protein